MREAPALRVITELVQRGASVTVYDPIATATAKHMFNGTIRYAADPYSCADGAEALVLLTEWPEFKDIRLASLWRHMTGNVLVDGRNALDRDEAIRAGFAYHGIGRGGTGPSIMTTEPVA